MTCATLVSLGTEAALVDVPRVQGEQDKETGGAPCPETQGTQLVTQAASLMVAGSLPGRNPSIT